MGRGECGERGWVRLLCTPSLCQLVSPMGRGPLGQPGDGRC